MGRPKITRTCHACGALLKQHKYKFCDNKCQQQYAWDHAKRQINASGMFRKYKCRSNIPKRYLIERDGHKCAICGLSEWNGEKAPLVVDHIDGDHDNMNINNFRLLCPNCDAQTPHYKGKNRGRGRQYRRERYQQGLSY